MDIRNSKLFRTIDGANWSILIVFALIVIVLAVTAIIANR